MSEISILKKLNNLGLNERESRLYLSLLQVKEASASDLHRMSGVPRTKVYEALENMIRRGICTERFDGRKKYVRAVAPDIVKQVLIEQWELDLKARRSMADSVSRDLQALISDQTEADRALEFIEVIRSKNLISRRYVSLVEAANEEILSFTRPPYAAMDAQSRRQQEIAEIESAKRGVKRRTIYVTTDSEWAWIQSVQERLDRFGEAARFIDRLPVKMFVFDRLTTLLGLQSIPGKSKHDFSMIVVRDEELAEACTVLFEVYWMKARTMAQETARVAAVNS